MLTNDSYASCQSNTFLTPIHNYNLKMADRDLISVNEIRPFIFSNGLESWSALKLWTPLFFKEKYGEFEFNVNLNLPDKDIPYLYDAKLYYTLTQLSVLIDLMSENKSCYLAQENMRIFKDLKEDYDFTNLIPPSNREQDIVVNLWIGANTRSGLHFDNFDNFLAQIYGVKKVILIPPSDAAFVYSMPSNFYKSLINPFEPNFNKYPRFKKAKVFEGKLEPGHVLFIPKGWYHYIYSPKQSISLNCWYGVSLTPKDLLVAFYRSGWQSWITCMKDLIWYGILSKPFETKLYSGPPMGKTIYDWIKMKLQQ